ncbi:hypothetical protein SD427_12155 [Chryseobacterium sp. JJR-5R]|uniref:hypothetical protein n=1 Tax=Chryseobacterium sp. JJR-5R TaxID=3093923 RepID=UPI002A756C88|nr:hypothetical protein [Chryseobacterium sp. JJR-5R]WPO81515.1 hypothetical protein SD427_12155 [Chryseobacterium sp. JJR-5R]
MRKNILSTLLVLFAISIKCQINPGGYIQNSVNSIAPKSPDAAALFRYTETPVSLYTGVPDINIPLYTIKEGDIEVPISISYHGGGIKVNDEASSIGLGWSLNAGGSVSQIMAGANDFSTDGYYNIYPKSFGSLIGSVSNCPTVPWNSSTQTNAYYSDSFMTIKQNGAVYTGWDFQPDLFLINIPGKSYKAYLDMEKTIKPNGPLKFAIAEQPNIDFKLIGYPSSNASYNFEVIDEKGIKYTFLKNEITIPMPGWNSISGLSKRLSNIDDIKGNSISFTYSNNISNYKLSGAKNTRTDFTYAPGMSQNYQIQNGLTDYSKQSVEESYLEKINFANGSVIFIWSDREDVYNSKKLSSIKIFNNQKLIKEYNFNYDYFVATDNLDTNSIAAWLGATSNKIFTHRLKLMSILNPITNENYSFGYNVNHNLPNKLSFSSDFWGYFNGQNNSDTFIPDPDKYIKGETPFNVTSFQKDASNYWYEATAVSAEYSDGHFRIYKNYSSDGKHYLSDRRASMYSLAGLLTSVTYPTGGKTEYEYEPNTYSNFPLQSLINDNTRIEKGANYSINNINGNIVHNNNATEFTITGNNIKVNITARFGFYYLSSANNNSTNYFWAYIKNKSTGQIVKKIYNTNLGSYQNIFFIDNIILQGGTYEVGMSYNNDFNYNNLYTGGSTAILNSCTIKYNEEKSIINGIEHNYSSGGGVRIKSIKSTEKPGANSIITNYIYDESTDGGTKITSNGNLAELPKFFEIQNRCFEVLVYNPNMTRIIPRPNCTTTPSNSNSKPFKISVYEATQSQGASTLPQGTHVGYSKVTEQIIGKGKTENHFINNYNQSCINMAVRGASLLIGDGDLTKQIVYDNNSNKIRESIFNYSFNYPNTLNTYFISASILDPVTNYVTEYHGINPNGVGSYYYELFGGIVHNYSINLYKSLLDSTVTREYFPAGSNNYIESKVSNIYNNKYLLARKLATFPDNSITENTYQYAHEKNNQKLITANMIGIPLETTTIKKQNENDAGKTVSKTEVVYPDQNNYPTAQAGSLLLPLSLKSSDQLTGVMSTDVTYDKYDEKGNIVQYTAKDGIPVTIVWGYNQTQPIAKIAGAKLSDIPQSLINIIVSASDTDASATPNNDETSLLQALDNFRKDASLSNYQVTTYSYDPLIGVRSITPPSGIREVYIYDNARRLMEIRENDQTGKLLKEFKYNYKH